MHTLLVEKINLYFPAHSFESSYLQVFYEIGFQKLWWTHMSLFKKVVGL